MSNGVTSGQNNRVPQSQIGSSPFQGKPASFFISGRDLITSGLPNYQQPLNNPLVYPEIPTQMISSYLNSINNVQNQQVNIPLSQGLTQISSQQDEYVRSLTNQPQIVYPNQEEITSYTNFNSKIPNQSRSKNGWNDITNNQLNLENRFVTIDSISLLLENCENAFVGAMNYINKSKELVMLDLIKYLSIEIDYIRFGCSDDKQLEQIRNRKFDIRGQLQFLEADLNAELSSFIKYKNQTRVFKSEEDAKMDRLKQRLAKSKGKLKAAQKLKKLISRALETGASTIDSINSELRIELGEMQADAEAHARNGGLLLLIEAGIFAGSGGVHMLTTNTILGMGLSVTEGAEVLEAGHSVYGVIESISNADYISAMIGGGGFRSENSLRASLNKINRDVVMADAEVEQIKEEMENLERLRREREERNAAEISGYQMRINGLKEQIQNYLAEMAELQRGLG